MPGQGRPARDETGWRAGDAGCRGGDVGHRPLDAAPPTGGARPRGAGQQPAAAGVLAALARVAVGSVERLSGAVRLKQMIFFTQYMYPCWAGPRVCRAIPVQPTGSAYGCCCFVVVPAPRIEVVAAHESKVELRAEKGKSSRGI